MLLLSLAGLSRAEPPPPTSAEESSATTVSVNESFQVKYWRMNEPLLDPYDEHVNDYVEQINRIIPTATTGAWTVSAQIDEVSLFMNRYYLDDELVLEHDLVRDGTPAVFPRRFDAYVNPEKVRVQVDGQAGTLVLGDAYVAFGRGMALNLNRNVDIDIDTSVQGAKAVLRPGAWDVTLVVGQTNRQQVTQDLPNLQIPRDIRHLVAGARAERFGLGPANLGAHAVVYDFVEDPGFAASVEQISGPDAVVGGGTVELVGVGGMDFYVEGDVFGYGPDNGSPLGPDAPDVGYGVYGSAAAYPGPFVVLLEGKRYYQAERVNYRVGSSELYEVAVAPTLEYERVINEDTQTTLNSGDVWGGRLETSWAAVPGKLSPYVAVAVFRDLDLLSGHFNPVPETIVHPMLGTEWIDGELAVLLNGGYRVDDRDGDEHGTDRLVHGDLSFNFPLPGDLAGYVSAASSRFVWGPTATLIGTESKQPFAQAETAYSLTWAGRLTGTFSLDYSGDPLVLADSEGNLSERLFAGAELQVKPSHDLTIKGFYGAQKSGIRCAGGQCRQVPGFSGAKLAVQGTF